MARRSDYSYDSDHSGYVDDRHARRRRYRSPSEASSHYARSRHSRRYSYPGDAPRDEKSKAGTFVKLGLGIAFVHVVATCFNEWMKNKNEENEKRYRREKRRAFEKAKAKRRRDDDAEDRRRQREEDSDSEIEREVIIREGRRIAYVPVDAEPDRETSEIRGYLPAPEDPYAKEDWDDRDDEPDKSRRAQSAGGRSRSQFGRSKRVRGEDRDGRSRSRPAVDVPR